MHLPAQVSARIAWREMRAQPGRFVAVAVMVAAGVSAIYGVRTVSWQARALLRQDARQWIAADVAASIEDPPDSSLRAELRAAAPPGTLLTIVTETLAMTGSESSPDPVLASLKAVDPRHYPFYGVVELNPPLPLTTLDAGTVAVSADLLSRLGIAVGGALRIHQAEFRVAATITVEPDRFAILPTPFPRVLLTSEGLARSGVLRLGSQTLYRLLFRLAPDQDSAMFRARLRKMLPYADVVDYHDPSPRTAFFFDVALTFLQLAAWMALAMGSLGVALMMYLHIERSLDTVAALKVLGARPAALLRIYLLQAGALGLMGAAAGIALGRLVQSPFAALAIRYFPFRFARDWDLRFAAEALVAGLASALLATAVPLGAVRSVRPAVLLRRAMHEPASRIPSWPWAAPPLAALALLALAVTRTWIGVVFLGGLTLGLLSLYVTSRLLIAGLRVFVTRGFVALPAAVRQGALNIGRPGNLSLAICTGLAAGVMLTTACSMGGESLVRSIAASLPSPGANLFLWNFSPGERVAVEQVLGTPLRVARIVVLQLSKVNGVAVEDLPPYRRHTKLWLGACEDNASGTQRPNEVILSERTAAEYGVGVGDGFEFQTQAGILVARIALLRPLDAIAQAGAQMMFSCTAFEGLKTHTVAAAQVANPDAARRSLVEQYPGLAVLTKAELLSTLEAVTGRFVRMLRLISYMVLAGGVVLTMLLAAAGQRRRVAEMALLKALGARRSYIASMFAVEFGVLGALAGAMGGLLGAAFASLLLSALLHRPVIAFSPTVVLWSMAGTAGLAVLAGWLARGPTLQRKPLEILRG